jgi:hypothetical protein
MQIQARSPDSLILVLQYGGVHALCAIASTAVLEALRGGKILAQPLAPNCLTSLRIKWLERNYEERKVHAPKRI